MRRLGRYIFNGLTALSLLVCLATGVMWIRASDEYEMLVYHSDTTGHKLIAYRSGIEYLLWTENLDNPQVWLGYDRPSYSKGWHFRRIYWSQRDSGFTYQRLSANGSFAIGLPYWFICLITALAPAIRLTARLRRKRHPPGHCPQCGYDLRATPQRCPECGTVVAEATEKTKCAAKNAKSAKEASEARMDDGG